MRAMKKILCIFTTLPYPVNRDGLSVINYRLLENFPKDFLIDIISISQESASCQLEIKKLNNNIRNIFIFSDKHKDKSVFRMCKLLMSAFFRQKTVYDNFLKENDLKYDLIYTCVPPASLFLTSENIETPIFVNAVDSFALLNYRFYVNHKTIANFIKYKLYYKSEIKALSSKCLVNFVSDVDRNFVEGNNITSIVIPNGVDTKYFKKYNQNRRLEHTLLFVGNFNNISNTIGVNFFCKEVYPILKSRIRDLKLFIVGPNSNFSFHDKSIVVTGFVDDIRQFYHTCSVFIAPLVTGSGIKNKVLEAMASGIPVVTTDIGADGISIVNGKEILIANSISEWVDSIEKLLDDQTLHNKLSCSAMNFINEKYNWNITLAKYYDTIRSLIMKNKI